MILAFLNHLLLSMHGEQRDLRLRMNIATDFTTGTTINSSRCWLRSASPAALTAAAVLSIARQELILEKF